MNADFNGSAISVPFTLPSSRLKVNGGVLDPLSAVGGSRSRPLTSPALSLDSYSINIYTSDIAIEDPRLHSKVHSPGPQVDGDIALPYSVVSTACLATTSIPEDCIITEPYIQGERKGPLLSRSRSRSRANDKMPKKRRSLQSIFAPSFLQLSLPQLAAAPDFPAPSRNPRLRSPPPATPSHSSSTSTVSTFDAGPLSLSPQSSAPLEDLLDDDPFADLSPRPSFVSSSETSPYEKQLFSHTSTSPSYESPLSTPVLSPRSRLSPPESATSPSFGASSSISPPPGPTPQPGSMRPRSSTQVRPAHMKPAFKSRPSLPSLGKLAQMNVMVPSKVRKGKVGAGLPYEPWDTLSSVDSLPTKNWLDEAVRDPSYKKSYFANSDFTVGIGDFLDLPGVDTSEEETHSQHAVLPTLEDPDATPTEESYLQRAANNGDSSLPHLISSYPSTPSLTRSTSFSTSMSPPSSHAAAHYSTRIDSHQLPDPIVSDLHCSTYYSQSSDDVESDPLSSATDCDYYSASSQIALDDFSFTAKLARSLSRPSLETVPVRHSDARVPDKADMRIPPRTSPATVGNTSNSIMNKHRRFASVQEKRTARSSQPVEAGGHDERNSDLQRGHSAGGKYGGGGGYHGGGKGDSRGGGDDHYYSGSNNHWQGNTGGGGREDGDDDKDRRPVEPSAFSSSEDERPESEDEDSPSDYGESDSRSPADPDGASATDDDVPLAQRIPSALKAQNTIRRQVRDERDRRRKERSRREQQTQPSKTREAPTSPPPNAGRVPPQQNAVTSSDKVAPFPPARQRTKTMPSSTDRPFIIDDLTKKLMSVQASGSPPTAVLPPSYIAVKETSRTSHSKGVPQGHIENMVAQREPSQPREVGTLDGSRERTLRPMRSFHRSEHRSPELDRPVPASADLGQMLSRRATTGRTHRTHDDRARTGEDRYTSANVEKPARVYRSSEEGRRSSRDGHVSRRGSPELEPRGTHRPPVPPLPPAEVLATLSHSLAKVQLVQQRIFVGDMQRFNMVEVSPSTNALDVLRMVESQGALEGWAGVGGWMLWEVAQDFGMERPIRSFELLSDVTASWNKDKMVNTFVIKKTRLASLLSRSAIPSSSPIYRGYVEWESKRGKWNKRWMELREHSLWLAKRNTGKDETFLCSLSNFDAYFVTRLHKSPKSFVFAVKSSDNLSLFENAADYLHVFSCNEKEGEKWMDNILLARSYVLHQERNVLFAGKAHGADIGTSGAGHSLSRSGTRKQLPGQKPPQTLVNVAPPYSANPTNIPSSAVFEPGSLLAKKA